MFFHHSLTMSNRLGTRLKTGCWLIACCLLATSANAASSGQSVTREKMESFLRRQIIDAGPWKPEDMQVRVVPFEPLSVPLGSVGYRLLRPRKGFTPGLHNFLVAVDVSGKEVGRVWVKTEIKVFEEVVVSSYPLAHHEVITAKDVRVERRDVSLLAVKPFNRIEEVVGQQTARAVEVNEILTAKSVDRPTLMRRGSAVVLVYETGSLRAEVPGIAEEGGKAGDLIQVRNPRSGKVLRGVVLDRRVVKVN